jgi:hypothetical protein
MVLYPRIRKKKTPATSICTSDLLAHGFPPGKTITSSELFNDEKQKVDTH